MVSILIMNGPNLNLLGTRQPEVYGATTLSEIEAVCVEQAASVGAEVTFFQSNHEGDLIDQIHAARGKFDGIILNAGALSHTSIAIMDAIFSVEIPTIDMHLSNIHRREEFRSVSYVAKAAIGSICGFGPGSYLLAIDAMMMHLGSAPSAADDDDDDEPDTKAEPLATTMEQMLPEESPAPEPDAEPEEPSARNQEQKSTETQTTETQAEVAAAVAAAAASAVAAEKGEEPAAAQDAEPVETPKEPKAESKKKRTSAFNEMFDTPSKDVLDSLGIAAPELNPPGKKEEAPKTGKSPLRSFRKFS